MHAHIYTQFMQVFNMFEFTIQLKNMPDFVLWYKYLVTQIPHKIQIVQSKPNKVETSKGKSVYY